uniref:PDZ domain-containing protein n=1 Tax=Trichuris muris TaxID=70415 RepID=A0A5S6QLR3_TRIMR
MTLRNASVSSKAKSSSSHTSKTSYRSLSRTLGPKVYGDVYSSFELPGTKIYRSDEIYHGLVLLSDSKGYGHPARLELTPETLTVQLPTAFDAGEVGKFTDTERVVIITRQPDGGLGFSIKGGEDGSCKVPVLISKVSEMQTCYSDSPLFVGDTILAVNGQPVDGKPHDEIVQILSKGGPEVTLKVRFNSGMAHFLCKSATNTAGTVRSDSFTEKVDDIAEAENFIPFVTNCSDVLPPKGWKNITTIPLQMAYVTRYLWGTDRVRSNGFEVRSVDGTSTGVILIEDGKVLSLWVRHISNNITNLNNKSIKLSNKYLHPDELIVYLGWVCERLNVTNVESGDFLKSWEPRFLILKGNECFLFESPPMNTEEFKNSAFSQKIQETRFRDLKEHERISKREYSFIVETVAGENLYLSVESFDQLLQVRGAWQRCTYYAINKLETFTFACANEDRPSALVFDVRHGIGFYDVSTKKYLWWYKFSDLRSTADDGKLRVRLVFYNKKYENREHVINLDCTDLIRLVFYLHAYLLARIMSVDPDYLNLKSPKAKTISAGASTT